MNKNIILKGMAGLLVAGSLVSCSDDYLDVKPVTSIDTSTVTGTSEGGQQAVYGICNSMWFPYSSFSAVGFFNGEAGLMQFYGEIPSPDYFSIQWSRQGADFMNWEYMNRDQYVPTYAGWMYGYNLVNQANTILSGVDTAEGTENDLAFIKAQALTLRAHAYVQLMKIYGPRWEDSRNGERYALVHRLTPGTGPAPLVTINTTMDQIYKDLDQAIELYKKSSKKRSYSWEPDITIAQGIYARAALLKNDWQTARKMAAAARADYPIMSADEYKKGFVVENKEYMWTNAVDATVCGFWNWGTLNACNGAYVSYWGNGSGYISYDLVRKMTDDDIRLDMFWTPRYSGLESPLSIASFWNPDIVDKGNMNCNGNAAMKLQISKLGVAYKEQIPNSEDKDFADSYALDGETGAASSIMVPFGAQFKFWGAGRYTISQFPFMRGAEMLLIEAEAAYRLHDETATRTLLTELNSKRHTGTYDISSLSGNALWEEYMLSSRLELWGEGHTWFNMKRWSVTAERTAWEEGNTMSNNIPAIFRSIHTPDAQNGWRWVMPYQESNQNSEADRSLLDY